MTSFCRRRFDCRKPADASWRDRFSSHVVRAVWLLGIAVALGPWSLCADDRGTAPSHLRSETQSTGAERPNILIIYVDDLGWRDVGFMGSDYYETPNLDALARGGMTFSNAYSCAANCAPARACLLTGQYTPRHRIFNVGTRPRGKEAFRRLIPIPGTDTLPATTPTWARTLNDAGYATAIMGKWHLSRDPLQHGFQINIGGSHSGSPPRGYYPPHPGAPGLEQAPPDEYLTDRLSREAVSFVRDHRDRPWCLYLAHFAVHTPIQAKRELLDKYRQKPPGKLHHNVDMATMIQAVDDGVGQLVRALDETGQRERTMILFTSDNGGYGPATDMAPLRGYKGTYYEGGIRVPMVVNWPGVVPASRTSNVPVIGVDLFPTICAVTGVAPPRQHECDGVDLLPLLRGEAEELAERDLYWHFPAYLQSYANVFDEQRDPLFRSRPCAAIRRGPWKLIEYFEDGAVELFHLDDDPGESNNRAVSDADVAADLQKRLHQWQKRVGAPVPDVPNPRYDASLEQEAIRKALLKISERK